MKIGFKNLNRANKLYSLLIRMVNLSGMKNGSKNWIFYWFKKIKIMGKCCICRKI